MWRETIDYVRDRLNLIWRRPARPCSQGPAAVHQELKKLADIKP